VSIDLTFLDARVVVLAGFVKAVEVALAADLSLAPT
jgi:hypothetical protein